LIAGKKDLTAILLPTKELCQTSEETFESLPQVSLSDQNVPCARDTGHNSKYLERLETLVTTVSI